MILNKKEEEVGKQKQKDVWSNCWEDKEVISNNVKLLAFFLLGGFVLSIIFIGSYGEEKNEELTQAKIIESLEKEKEKEKEKDIKSETLILRNEKIKSFEDDYIQKLTEWNFDYIKYSDIYQEIMNPIGMKSAGVICQVDGCEYKYRLTESKSYYNDVNLLDDVQINSRGIRMFSESIMVPINKSAILKKLDRCNITQSELIMLSTEVNLNVQYGNRVIIFDNESLSFYSDLEKTKNKSLYNISTIISETKGASSYDWNRLGDLGIYMRKLNQSNGSWKVNGEIFCYE
ncbi:hypothetical protein [Vibrio splendidus]|uniref:hypothetical protein n=1 Tax=Vibrio splendidus TaxID=29497 RepID=UPI0021B3DEBF|nr:hypothetical protein [Vibrio splendidus]UWZ98593.1 hypothetical protein IM698_04350 [Vibrio splendidus]